MRTESFGCFTLWLVSPRNRPRSVRFGFGFCSAKNINDRSRSTFSKKSKNRPNHFRFRFTKNTKKRPRVFFVLGSQHWQVVTRYQHTHAKPFKMLTIWLVSPSYRPRSVRVGFDYVWLQKTRPKPTDTKKTKNRPRAICVLGAQYWQVVTWYQHKYTPNPSKCWSFGWFRREIDREVFGSVSVVFGEKQSPTETNRQFRQNKTKHKHKQFSLSVHNNTDWQVVT